MIAFRRGGLKMNRQIPAMLAFAGVGLLVAAAATAGQTKPAPAGQSKPATPPATEPAAPAKFTPPVRGQAELGYLKPVTKRAGSEIVTVIKVKNLANGPIAGLKVDEFWYDKAGDPVTGDTFRYKKLFMPGEVIEV